MEKQAPHQEAEAWPPQPFRDNEELVPEVKTKLTMGSSVADAIFGMLAGFVTNFCFNSFLLIAGSLVWIEARKVLLPQAKPAEGNFGTGSPLFLWITLTLSLVGCLLIPAVRRPRNLTLTLAFVIGVCSVSYFTYAFWLWMNDFHMP